jgi:CMP-N-acetylneuraminic acid synthetase
VRVLAIVPARLGSKGIPKKNIRLLGGKPLLAYTAGAAAEATRLTRTILSTDDAEIAAVGRSCGLEVPFLRPSELARDETPTVDVLRHALEWVEACGEAYEAVCLLEPTSPFRRPQTIDECLRLLEEGTADAVVTVRPVPDKFNPHWVYFRERGGTLRISTGEGEPISRRQDLPAAYYRDGCVYATKRDVIMNQKSIYGRRLVGYVVQDERSVNIDTLDDWGIAERLLASSTPEGK